MTKTLEQITNEAIDRVTQDQVEAYVNGRDVFGFGLPALTTAEIKAEIIRSDATYIAERDSIVANQPACYDPCV